MSPETSQLLSSLSLQAKEILLSSPVSYALKFLLAAGALHRLNSFISKLAHNSWTSDPTWNWSHEVILITGGSSGVGFDMMRKFASRGIKVVVIDVNAPRTSLPPTVSFYQCDVTSTSALREVAEKVRKEVGEPSVLINNAGVGTGKNILDEEEHEVKRTFGVNIMAHFNTVKEFVPSMVKRNHGHIVTLASMASFVTVAGNVDYSCTKAAALAFHEGLTQELRWRYKAKRVRTTIVHPTWVRTPLIEELLSKPGFNDPVLEPDAVADVIVNQVLKGEGAQLILPKKLTWVVSSLRGASSWFQELVRNGQATTLERPEGM